VAMVMWPPKFLSIKCSSSKMVKDMDFKFDTRVPRVGPDMTPQKFLQKGEWPGSRDPLNCGGLNVNSFKTVKAMDFKFDKHVYRDSLDMAPLKLFRKGGVARIMWPLNFWALNAYKLQNG